MSGSLVLAVPLVGVQIDIRSGVLPRKRINPGAVGDALKLPDKDGVLLNAVNQERRMNGAVPVGQQGAKGLRGDFHIRAGDFDSVSRVIADKAIRGAYGAERNLRKSIVCHFDSS